MKNKDLYEKTVSILVDAYMNDTLKHSNCSACAVGNIICANMGISAIELWFQLLHKDSGWNKVFVTSFFAQRHHPENYKGLAKEQIDSTGYHWQDLAKIEHAFETADIGDSADEWMFNGLMAVIEALDLIHSNTDQTLTTHSKARFAKVQS